MQVARARRRPRASSAKGSPARTACASPGPTGAFYLFFAVEGVADTGRLGLTLVDEANIGIAPGTAFGAGRRGIHAPLLRAQGGGSQPRRRGVSAPGSEADAGFRTAVSCGRAGDLRSRSALSAAGGLLFQSLGMPAGWVSGGLLAVAIASLAGFDSDVPQPIRAPVYLVLGLYAGGGVSQQTIHQMATWPLSFAILGVSLVALIASSYWWLHMRCGWDRNAALLSSLPGALSFVMAAAEGLKADLKKVAIAQSLRLLILVEVIPIVALVIGHPSPAAVTGRRRSRASLGRSSSCSPSASSRRLSCSVCGWSADGCSAASWRARACFFPAWSRRDCRFRWCFLS